MYFLLYVCLCIFNEYVFTLYSKQINNYKLILLACECVCFFCGSLAILFFFLEAAPIRILQNRWGPKTGSLLVCVSGLSVCSISAQPFCWEIGTVQLQLRLFFLFVSSFSNKDWTFKTTTLLYCLLFSVIRVFLPFHKYIIVKKLETLIPLTYMYDHKVAY